MSDNPNPIDPGTPPGDTPPEGTAPPKTFTQADLDRIVADRIRRERAQFADYGDLKTKAQELDALREASKSEADRLRDRHDKAVRERDEALGRQRETMIRTAIVEEAVRQGAADPHDIAALIDRSELNVEGDKVEGVQEAVKALLGRKRYLLQQSSRRAGAELQGTENALPPRITRSEIRAWAAGADGGLTAERQKQIEAAHKAGRIDADR